MKNTKTERIAIRIDPSLKKKLLASAKMQGISYSEAIRKMIKKNMNHRLAKRV